MAAKGIWRSLTSREVYPSITQPMDKLQTTQISQNYRLVIVQPQEKIMQSLRVLLRECNLEKCYTIILF